MEGREALEKKQRWPDNKTKLIVQKIHKKTEHG